MRSHLRPGIEENELYVRLVVVQTKWVIVLNCI